MRTFTIASLLAAVAFLSALAMPSRPQRIPDIASVLPSSRLSMPSGAQWGVQERRHRLILPRADRSRVEEDVNDVHRDGRPPSQGSPRKDKLRIEADKSMLAARAVGDESGAFSTLQSGVSSFIKPEHPTTGYGSVIEYRAERRRALIDLLVRGLAELD